MKKENNKKTKKKGSKILVLYYSRSGTTKKLGESIKEILNADSEEIIDNTSREGIFGWLKTGRDSMKKKLTEIKEITKDPSKYDLIIIGSPVFAGSLSPAIRTYLSKNKGSLKKIVFYSTHGGESPGKIFLQMEELINKKPIKSFSYRSKNIKNGNYKEDLNMQIEEFKDK